MVYNDIGDRRKALDNYTQALLLHRFVKDKIGEAKTLSNEMLIWQRVNVRFAIFYGKLCVNSFQKIRSINKELDRDDQKNFLKSNEIFYKRLAEMLIEQGRFEEALQILNSFRDQQYFDFGQTKQKLPLPLSLTTREADFVLRYEEAIERARVVGQLFEDLKRKIGNRLPDEQQKAELQKMESDVKIASDEFLGILKRAEIEFNQPPSEKDKVRGIPDSSEMKIALRDLQSQTGRKTIALHTLVGENNFWTLIVTSDGLVSAISAVKDRDLNAKAAEFARKLGESNIQSRLPKFSREEVQKSAKELYEIVFAPVASKLKELGLEPEVLMWSLDGSLRYVPVGALYDGKQYLAERYRNVVFTRASPDRMLAPVSKTWTGSGFYLSEEQTIVDILREKKTFQKLIHARREVETIFGTGKKPGILQGNVSYEQLTQGTLFQALKLNRPLVHIASHFRFAPGDSSLSYLVLADNQKLTLEDLKKAPNDLFQGVELLTLSACETAVQKERESDGREIDGFAELAQRKGAKAILASLWKVDDESTSQLMTKFYQGREKGRLTKIEALQQAQLDLIKSEDYSHPYYWAPFILIGNWK